MKALPLLKIAAVAASLVCVGVTAQAAGSSGASSTEASSAPSASSESLGQHLSDGAVTTKVKAALMTASDLKSTRIHVKTRRGIVWLTGSVPTSDEKTRAQQVVEGVTGVHEVKNRLKISEAGSAK